MPDGNARRTGPGCGCRPSPHGQADGVSRPRAPSLSCKDLPRAHSRSPPQAPGPGRGQPSVHAHPTLPAVPQWRLLCMDGTAFGVMKYSQVSGSLRNDGDQSIPFQGVIFFPFTACFMLTIISMSKGLDRRRLSELRTRAAALSGVARTVPGRGVWSPARTPPCVEPSQDTPVGWQVGSHSRLSQGCGGLAGGPEHPALLGLANLPAPWTLSPEKWGPTLPRCAFPDLRPGPTSQARRAQPRLPRVAAQSRVSGLETGHAASYRHLQHLGSSPNSNVPRARRLCTSVSASVKWAVGCKVA